MGIQVALALFVLVVAGLFFQRFQESRDTDPGFRADGVLLAAYDLTGRGTDARANRQFASRVLRALQAMPGVESVALASSVPLDIHGLPSRGFVLEGRPRLEADPDQALSNIVTPGYLRTMGIPLLAGSDFAPLDDTAAPPQAIVNDAFVRRYLDGGEAIGRRIETRGVSYVIVGVARTSVYDAFGEPPTPIVLYSYRDRPLASAEIHVRTRPGTETAMTATIRARSRISIRACRSTTCGRCPNTSPRTSCCGGFRRACSWCSDRCCSCSRPSASTPSSTTPLPSGRRRLACVWRLAPGLDTWLDRSCVKPSGLSRSPPAGASAIAVAVDLHLVRGGARDIPVLVDRAGRAPGRGCHRPAGCRRGAPAQSIQPRCCGHCRT